MQGLGIVEMLIFLNQLPELFIPNTLHPFFTNPPLPGIRMFLASTLSTSTTTTSTNTSTNTITSTTRSIQDDSVLQHLLEYDSVSDELEADLSID